ncbi:MAG: iron-containing redox enzyme family protein [Acidimicrobiales bacterium]
MDTSLNETLNQTLRDRQLLSHPFYRRWECGQLGREELTSYAEQYRYFETMLPRFLDALSERLPEGPARDAVLDNLRDETMPPSHLELFELFATFYDANVVSASPAMTKLLDAYSEVLKKSPEGALAGLWAYESQGAAVASSKAEGLRTHYGADSAAIAFWDAHWEVEGDHAAWTLDALSMLEPDVEEVASAARLVGEAWWSFLDERELVNA